MKVVKEIFDISKYCDVSQVIENIMDNGNCIMQEQQAKAYEDAKVNFLGFVDSKPVLIYFNKRWTSMYLGDDSAKVYNLGNLVAARLTAELYQYGIIVQYNSEHSSFDTYKVEE